MPDNDGEPGESMATFIVRIRSGGLGSVGGGRRNGGSGGADGVFEHGAAREWMRHFGQARSHPCAFARREDDDPNRSHKVVDCSSLCARYRRALTTADPRAGDVRFSR